MHKALLTLNFPNANEKGTTVAERHWTIEKTSALNQPVYFKDVLTSERKPGHVLCWEMCFAFVSREEQKVCICSKFIKISLEQKKPLNKERGQLIHQGDSPTSCKGNSQRP